MKVYKKQTSADPFPYLDNCYIGERQNELDTDATSVFSLYEFFRVSQIDYIQYRNFCKEYVLPLWESLSGVDKKELVKHNMSPTEEEKLLFYTIEEQRLNFYESLKLDKQARHQRWEKAKQLIAFEYRLNQMYQLLMYQDTKFYKGDFIDANLPYLIYWVKSEALIELGIDFTTNGFNSKSYYSEPIKEKLLSILLNNVGI